MSKYRKWILATGGRVGLAANSKWIAGRFRFDVAAIQAGSPVNLLTTTIVTSDPMIGARYSTNAVPQAVMRIDSARLCIPDAGQAYADLVVLGKTARLKATVGGAITEIDLGASMHQHLIDTGTDGQAAAAYSERWVPSIARAKFPAPIRVDLENDQLELVHGNLGAAMDVILELWGHLVPRQDTDELPTCSYGGEDVTGDVGEFMATKKLGIVTGPELTGDKPAPGKALAF